MARTLYRSLTERLLTLPDHLVLYPSHYSGSVCGRGLSANPISTIGFERRHNTALQHDAEDAFVAGAHVATSRRPPSSRRRSSPPTARPAARRDRVTPTPVRLGLRENAAQFSLLVAVNAFVGAMVGPGALDAAADRPRDFHLTSQRRGAVVHRRLRRSRRRCTNLGRRRPRRTRRAPAPADRRVGGVALPVPGADRDRAELGAGSSPPTCCSGVNQGLAWSMTVVMKIDLVGPRPPRPGARAQRGRRLRRRRARRRRSAGCWPPSSPRADVVVVAGAAIAADRVPALRPLRPRHRRARRARAARHHPGVDGSRCGCARLRAGQLPRAGAALLLAGRAGEQPQRRPGLGARAAVPRRARRQRRASRRWSPRVYPAVWAIAQIATGHWSDTVGRKPLIVAGMLLQAVALALLALSGGDRRDRDRRRRAARSRDRARLPDADRRDLRRGLPSSPAPRSVGVYRFWRDSGYALGALIAGGVADALGYGGAIAIVAGLTAASGLWVLRDMPSDRGHHYPGAASAEEGRGRAPAPSRVGASDLVSAGSAARRA